MKKVFVSFLALMSVEAVAQYYPYQYPLYQKPACGPGQTGPCNYVGQSSNEMAPSSETTTTPSRRTLKPGLTDIQANLENPFFLPAEGQVYSKTTGEIGGRTSSMKYTGNLGVLASNDPFNIESDTEANFVGVEELGVGLTDMFSVYVRVGYADIQREYKNTTTNLTTLKFDENDAMGATGGLSLRLIRNESLSLNLHGEYTKAPDNFIGGYRDQMAAYLVVGKEKQDMAVALHLGILNNKEGVVDGFYDAFGNELTEKESTDYTGRFEILRQISPSFSVLIGLDYEMLSAETAGGSEDDVLRGRLQLNFGSNQAMLSLFGGYETHSWDKYQLTESGTGDVYEYDVRDTKGWLAGVRLGLTF